MKATCGCKSRRSCNMETSRGRGQRRRCVSVATVVRGGATAASTHPTVAMHPHQFSVFVSKARECSMCHILRVHMEGFVVVCMCFYVPVQAHARMRVSLHSPASLGHFHESENHRGIAIQREVKRPSTFDFHNEFVCYFHSLNFDEFA